MERKIKDELEQHPSDIGRLAAIPGIGPDQTEAAIRAERFFPVGMVETFDWRLTQRSLADGEAF